MSRTDINTILGLPNESFICISPGCYQSNPAWEGGFEHKVHNARSSYMPPCGDFIFCDDEDIDMIISDRSQIIIKYPGDGDGYFGEKCHFYVVNALNRYVTWRDACAAFESNKGPAADYHHRFIEDLCQETDVQWVMHCGS